MPPIEQKAPAQAQKIIDLDSPATNVGQFQLAPDKNSRVQVEDQAPFRITRVDLPADFKLPPVVRNQRNTGLAIIDDAKNQLDIGHGEKGEIVRGTHYEAVVRALGSVPVRGSFDVSGPDKTVDDQKILNAFQHILATHRESGISAVNLSIAALMPLADINSIVRDFAADKLKPDTEITRENIVTKSEAIRTALQRGIDEGAIDKSAQKLLDTAAAINKLSEQGVAVIIGGGNSGADQINLFGALAPDSIVVAGTNFSDPKQIAEASASSSIVDATANFEYNFRLPTGTSFTIYGTSLAAPNVAGETVRMQDEGMSVKEINQLFRLRMAQQLNPQVDQIILRDVAELTPGTGKESFRELIGQYAIDPDGAAGIISAYKVADKVGGLTPEDFHQLLSAAKGSFQSPAITSGELEQLTRGFAAVPATERPAFLERMRSTRSDNAEGLLKKLGR